MLEAKPFLKRTGLLALTALLVMSFVSSAWAKPPKGKHGKEKNSAERALKYGEVLHLTDEQKTNLRQLSFDYQKKAIQMKADIDLAKLSVGGLFREEPPAEAKILAQVDEVSKLKNALKKESIRLRFSVRKILTDEQRTLLDKQIEKESDQEMGRRMMGSQHLRKGGMGRNRQR